MPRVAILGIPEHRKMHISYVGVPQLFLRVEYNTGGIICWSAEASSWQVSQFADGINTHCRIGCTLCVIVIYFVGRRQGMAEPDIVCGWSHATSREANQFTQIHFHAC